MDRRQPATEDGAGCFFVPPNHCGYDGVMATDLTLSRLPRAAAWGLTLLFVLLGGWLRFTHLDWDGWQQLHPDERGIWFVAQTIHLPDSLSDATAPARSPLNPFRTESGERRTYPYGHLPLYASALLGRAVVAFNGEGVALALLKSARLLSALSDTLCIVAAALLAREIGGRWAGMGAAAFTATAVLHIQNAHFGTVDTTAALFATATVWLLARYAHSARRRDSVLAGVCLGLAAGSKITSLLLISPLLVTQVNVDAHPDTRLPRLWLKDDRDLWLTMAVAVAAFALTNPYALLDPIPFFGDIATQAAMVSGRFDWPFTRQYARTLPLWYALVQQAKWGLGIPLTLASLAGIGWGIARAIRRRDRAGGAAAVWALTVLLIVGVDYVKFPRYLLIATPAFASLAAASLLAEHSGRLQVVRRIMAAVVAATTLVWALAFHNLYDQPHPWQTATEWIYGNVRSGSTMTADRWDDPLPLDAAGRLRAANYTTVMLDPFAEPDDSDKLQSLLDDLARVDYVVLSSPRLWAVIPRLNTRYPLTAAMYRSLFAGELGFEPTASFTRYPHMGGLTFFGDPFQRPGLQEPAHSLPDLGVNLGWLDESYTVYDHPLVLIFENSEQLSADQMRIIVEAQARQ